MKNDPRELDADLEQLKSRQRAQLLRNTSPAELDLAKKVQASVSPAGGAIGQMLEKWAGANNVQIWSPGLPSVEEVLEEPGQGMEWEIEQRDQRIADLEHALSIVRKWAKSPYGEGVVPSSVWAVVDAAMKVHE